MLIINKNNLIKIFELVSTTILVIFISIAVALTYFVFEKSVGQSIDYIWFNLFDINNNRLLIPPILITLSLLFFGLNNSINKNKSEEHSSDNLTGGVNKYNIRVYFKVLLIGFLSLIAGASLGPEAILVPASLTIGHIISNKFSKDKMLLNNLAPFVAIIALFTSFLHSFIAGLLGILLAKKMLKIKINKLNIYFALVASIFAFITLNIIDPKNPYFSFPESVNYINYLDILFALGLVLVGYIITYLIKYSLLFFNKIYSEIEHKNWIYKAIFASLGLSLIYIISGPLVMFTGDNSIKPLLESATSIGIIGLLALGFLKILAIAWSKSFGYLGGLIFPTIFIVSCIISIVYLIYPEINYMFSLIASLIGVFIADRKVKVLL